VTKPAGTSIWLNVYPASGYSLSSWGGSCSSSFALTANVSCAPTFSNGSTTPPPPPSPSGSYTITITRPTNGLIAGPDIWCGSTSSTGTRCSVTKPAGTQIWLKAFPASGYSLTSWGGCSTSFALTGNVSCAPTFGGGSALPPPSGPISLRVVVPSTAKGHVYWMGVGWVEPGQSVLRTSSTPMTVSLSAFPFAGYVFGSWIGGGCANSMTVTTEMMCVASFVPEP
jgi:hypothetical protein